MRSFNVPDVTARPATVSARLHTFADCSKTRSVSIHDRCKATFGRRLP
jgi:hypothetical protein